MRPSNQRLEISEVNGSKINSIEDLAKRLSLSWLLSDIDQSLTRVGTKYQNLMGPRTDLLNSTARIRTRTAHEFGGNGTIVNISFFEGVKT